MPDVTLEGNEAVEVEIEARDIPVGTVVQVHVLSENAADQIIDSTPLVGTEELSTATATVSWPTGFSRAFLRATF